MTARQQACFVRPPDDGGVEAGFLLRAAERLARRLQADGWRVVWVTLRMSKAGRDHDGLDPDTPLLVPHPAVPPVEGVMGRVAGPAYRLDEWLKTQEFSRVVVIGQPGLLHYVLAGRLCGAFHLNADFWVIDSEPHAWVRRHNAELSDDPVDIARAQMERDGLAGADRVIIPNKAVASLAKLRAPGKRLVAAPNLFAEEPAGGAVRMPSGRPERLVVLGLDESMPAVRFLRDVVVRLEARGIGLPPIAVVTTRSLKRWRQKALVRLADGLTTEIALRQIASDRLLEEIGASRTLVLLPWQTLSRAATLTALATGGVSFLGVEHPTATAAFTPKTAQNALIPLNPNLWADRIAAALEGNWPAPKPRTGDLDPVLLTPPLAATPVKTATPLVSICLMHFERPRMIDLALRSIEAQDYPKLEVVLLDDGSRSKASVEKLDSLEKDFARRDWRVVRQQNRYLGAARNAAAATAKGEYLYFLDDDNALKPGAIASLVSAAEHTRADAVVSYADFFDTDEPPSTAPARHIPLGNAPALGLFLNAFGDSNALIRRSSFDALGGNREEYGVGKEDHEFYARLVLSGRRFVLLPEAVYWYRQSPGRLRSRHYAGHAGNLRILEAYAAAAPEWGEDIFLIAQGLMGHRASRGAATGEHSHTGGPLVGASDASLQLPGLHRFFRSVLAFENRAFGGFLELQARAAMGLANAIRGVRRLVRKNGTGSR